MQRAHTRSCLCVWGRVYCLENRYGGEIQTRSPQCDLLSANRPKHEPAKRFVYVPDSTNIDESFELFHDVLYAAINECIQRVRIRG